MSTTQEIENELLDFVRREVFPPDVEVTPETDLMGAGFDSMALVRVLQFIEKTHKLWIPEAEITGDTLKDIRSLAATVARLLPKG
ncbi:MAG TPA: phosphopantetheine-binding protein [Kiritimatiellia bacterium]|jgi:acyl carrier protein